MSKHNQPLRAENIEAIVDYYKSGIKDKCETIGIELEHTVVKKDGKPVSYNEEFGQQWILSELAGESSKKAFSKDGHLIGLNEGNISITLEPAAQVELSAGPFANIGDAYECFKAFEERLEGVVDKHDMEVLTPGYHPTSRAIDLQLIPKMRYKFMTEYLGAISMYGICMMRGSAATQVAIDYCSEEDCLLKMRLANACVPILSLICDNSPIFEGEIRPHQLMRTEIWEKCDPDRCMTVPGVMDADFTLEDYAEYILDTPAIVQIENEEESLSEKTFGEIFADKKMERADVEHALSMFFTDVRLKTYIEIRPADAMPFECAIAYAAMIKGLFYNRSSIDAMCRMFDGVGAQDIMNAKQSLMADGYAGKVYGHAASVIADELLSIAETGLPEDEVKYLKPIAELIANRTTLADIALSE